MSMIDLQREGYLPSGGVPQLPVTSGLEFYLDASVAASVDTANQKWRNLVASPASGAAQIDYDFILGANTTSGDYDEALHVGTAAAGHKYAYWNMNGNAYFKLPARTNFTNSISQDGATFTLWFLISSKQEESGRILISSKQHRNSIGHGFVLYTFNENKLAFEQSNDGQISSFIGDSRIVSGTNTFFAVSIHENGGDISFFYENGAYKKIQYLNTFNANYASPGSGDSEFVPALGHNNDTGYFDVGDEVIAVGAYNRAISKAELDQIYRNFKAQGRL